MKQAISAETFLSKQYETISLPSALDKSLGKVELRGSWIIWGDSSSGKTTFTLKLVKALEELGITPLYISFEEGYSSAFQRAVRRQQLAKTYILDGEAINQLNERLGKQRAKKIVIIDSIQHSLITKEQYKHLRENNPDKLFIFISHAQGKIPKGEVADFIRYDSDIKIRVEGYRAFPTGRLNGGGDFFDIYPERSKVYHQEVSP